MIKLHPPEEIVKSLVLIFKPHEFKLSVSSGISTLNEYIILLKIKENTCEKGSVVCTATIKYNPNKSNGFSFYGIFHKQYSNFKNTKDIEKLSILTSTLNQIESGDIYPLIAKHGNEIIREKNESRQIQAKSLEIEYVILNEKIAKKIIEPISIYNYINPTKEKYTTEIILKELHPNGMISHRPINIEVSNAVRFKFDCEIISKKRLINEIIGLWIKKDDLNVDNLILPK